MQLLAAATAVLAVLAAPCRTLWGMPREVEKSMHQFQFIDICIWLCSSSSQFLPLSILLNRLVGWLTG